MQTSLEVFNLEMQLMFKKIKCETKYACIMGDYNVNTSIKMNTKNQKYIRMSFQICFDKIVYQTYSHTNYTMNSI